MSKVVVSLTTIPPRMSDLDECLRSLLAQSARIDEINLYVPREYRRFPGAYTLPKVPQGVNVKVIEEDLGPATKVLPAVRDYAGTDTLILFCDDDRAFPTQWAQRLIDSAQLRPHCAVSAAGHQVVRMSDFDWSTQNSPVATFVRKDALYRLKRALSLGLWKPQRIQSSGHVDTLCGWAGCAIRPEFFVEEDFEIPDVLWTVDDVWLSGCLEKNGVPIWLEKLGPDAEPRAAANDIETFALRTFTYKGFDRFQANAYCIQYFRENHQIWGG